MTGPVGKIEVVKTSSGFTVYGRFGALIHASSDKAIIYSNLVDNSDEYLRMVAKLAKEPKV